jgi:hypothetical protein
MKMKTAEQTAQHGDVVLRKLDAMPVGKPTRVSKCRCVLADGEHTGHQHVVEDDEAELIQIGERMLLKLGRAATVVHPEHKPIRLSPGIWEVGRVLEHDWLQGLTRQVVD